MSWKAVSVELQRQQLCHQVVGLGRPVAEVCREFGVSRKTAYKWLARRRADPSGPMSDRSRRPKGSPGRTPPEVEAAVLAARDQHNWGGRKIRLVLGRGAPPAAAGWPSVRTITAIVRRHGRVGGRAAAAEAPATARFERGAPNELWQMDHKGPLEIGRARYHPLTVVDDHSRFCLCFEPLAGASLALAWPVLWGLFGEYGLPGALLSDGAFASRGGPGLSDLDQRLIRLGVEPIHGRAYHPQTQGKVERFHGTVERELLGSRTPLGFAARTDTLANFAEDRDRWRRAYNALRPHEALGDAVPVSRYRRGDRARPDALPEVEYPAGAVLRRVSQVGDIHFARVRVGVARSLAGQMVRVEEREREVAVYYAWKEIRVIALDRMAGRGHNQRT